MLWMRFPRYGWLSRRRMCTVATVRLKWVFWIAVSDCKEVTQEMHQALKSKSVTTCSLASVSSLQKVFTYV